MKRNSVYVLGGTCGTGKSTIADALEKALRIQYPNLKYIEGDSLHSQENIKKMGQGVPLTDLDRWNWLELVARTSGEEVRKNHGPCIITCSSLKKKYRDFIQSREPDIVFRFFLLYAPKEEVLKRVQKRSSHFMKSNMVESQFADLELPANDEKNTTTIEVNGLSIEGIVCKIIKLSEEV